MPRHRLSHRRRSACRHPPCCSSSCRHPLTCCSPHTACRCQATTCRRSPVRALPARDGSAQQASPHSREYRLVCEVGGVFGRRGGEGREGCTVVLDGKGIRPIIARPAVARATGDAGRGGRRREGYRGRGRGRYGGRRGGDGGARDDGGLSRRRVSRSAPGSGKNRPQDNTDETCPESETRAERSLRNAPISRCPWSPRAPLPDRQREAPRIFARTPDRRPPSISATSRPRATSGPWPRSFTPLRDRSSRCDRGGPGSDGLRHRRRRFGSGRWVLAQDRAVDERIEIRRGSCATRLGASILRSRIPRTTLPFAVRGEEGLPREHLPQNDGRPRRHRFVE